MYSTEGHNSVYFEIILIRVCYAFLTKRVTSEIYYYRIEIYTSWRYILNITFFILKCYCTQDHFDLLIILAIIIRIVSCH